MHTHRRYSKRELLGHLRVEYLFSVHELPNVTSSSSRWEILGAFLKAGEGRAERLIETDGGFLFLQSIPGRRDSGAIYAYNEATKAFLWMRFDRDDDLNGGLRPRCLGVPPSPVDNVGTYGQGRARLGRTGRGWSVHHCLRAK